MFRLLLLLVSLVLAGTCFAEKGKTRRVVT
jgi:hypothetical protein